MYKYVRYNYYFTDTHHCLYDHHDNDYDHDHDNDYNYDHVWDYDENYSCDLDYHNVMISTLKL